MLVVAVFLSGLLIGSFLKAAAWRLGLRSLRSTARRPVVLRHRRGTTMVDRHAPTSLWRGRSACTQCGHQLAARDLVPVLSWVMLRGRCRYCTRPISAWYPVIEVLTAAVFVLAYLAWSAVPG